MKKLIALTAVLALVAACGAEEQTGPKYATNLNAVTEYLVSGACEHIGAGDAGDYVLKCAPSDVFDEALSAQKTAKVLSAQIDITAALADTEHVYVNVAPNETCPMAVLIAGANINDMYASVVCPEGYVAE